MSYFELQEIDDPEDKKPEDWVEEAKIDDPNAKKPDDWDESAVTKVLTSLITIISSNIYLDTFVIDWPSPVHS